jgi:peptidoglycan/LPS O-acetylase OafA/YrhL
VQVPPSVTTAAAPAVDTRKSSESKFYRPELDALRFLAFLMVFMHHSMVGPKGSGLTDRILAAIRDTGAFGVCLFFLLSSYLISELLLREQQKTGSIHIKSFYVRRILRIWPLYFFILILGYVAGLMGFTSPISLGRLAAFFLLAGNWYTGIFGYTGNFIMPLWSIAIEEQFYLLWPTIARVGRKTGILIAGIFFWALSFVALYILCKRHASLNEAIWTNTFVQFQFFALGGLLALALHGRVPRFSNILRIPIFIAGFSCYFIADFVFHIKSYYDSTPAAGEVIPGYFLAGVGTLLVFLGILGAKLPRFMNPFVYLGKISYGLYSYHILAMLIVHKLLVSYIDRLHHGSVLVMPTSFVLTILMAIPSYKYLETPFLRLKEKFTFVHSRGV